MTGHSVSSGAAWESRYGYHRAVSVGDEAWVSGTTAASAGAAPPEGAGAQAEVAFAIALDALSQLGFGVDDVVRTRMYLTDIAEADAVGRVHGRLFAATLADAGPAATMVAVSALVDPALVVEIELEARRRGRA